MIKPYGRTTPVPLRHRQIDKLIMLDWIRTRLEAEQPAPTDAEIMERFGFVQPEQARTLLADLSDAGKITIFGTGDDREIMLGRVRPSERVGVGRPIPSVVRPETKPTSAKVGAERIARILHGVQAKKVAPKPTVEQLEDAGAKLSTAGKTIAEQLQPIVEAAQSGEPNVVDAKRIKTATLAAVASVASPIPEDRGNMQVNACFRADPALYDRIITAARAEGVSISRYMGQMAKAAFLDREAKVEAPAPAQPERKPLLRADMTAAAIRNGMPVDAFVRLLLERGFQAFLAEEQKGIAA